MSLHLRMQTASVAAGLAVGLSPIVIALTSLSSTAQNSYYYAGDIDNQKLLVNLSSIRTDSSGAATFDYLLGDRTLSAQASCTSANAWTDLVNETTHYAQSQTDRNMLRIVCGHSNESFSTQQTQPPITRPPIIEPATPAALPTPIEPPTPSDAPVAIPVEIAVEPYSPPISPAPERTATTQTALVYDPSSNVRATPNGQILCSVDTVSYINIYGHIGDWYDTDVCGVNGVIHISQISFNQ